MAIEDSHHCIRFDKVELSGASIYERMSNQKALDFSENMQNTREFSQKTLVVAYKSRSKQANKYKKDISYVMTNKVMISIKNITTN